MHDKDSLRGKGHWSTTSKFINVRRHKSLHTFSMLKMEAKIVFLIVFRTCEPLGARALPERNCTYYCVSGQTEPTGYPTHVAGIFSRSSLHLRAHVASRTVIGQPSSYFMFWSQPGANASFNRRVKFFVDASRVNNQQSISTFKSRKKNTLIFQVFLSKIRDKKNILKIPRCNFLK